VLLLLVSNILLTLLFQPFFNEIRTQFSIYIRDFAMTMLVNIYLINFNSLWHPVLSFIKLCVLIILNKKE